MKKLNYDEIKEGDIVTFRNGNRHVVNKNRGRLVVDWLLIDGWKMGINEGEHDIVKVERLVTTEESIRNSKFHYYCYETIYEEPEKKQILTEEERDFLLDLIYPNIDNIDYISKHAGFLVPPYLYIHFKDDIYITVPASDKYKGIKLNENYTLKQLDLIYDEDEDEDLIERWLNGND